MRAERRNIEVMVEGGDDPRPRPSFASAAVPAWGLVWPGLSAAVAVTGALYGLVVTPLQKANDAFQERALRNENAIAQLQFHRAQMTSWQSTHEKEFEKLRADLAGAVAERNAYIRRVEDKSVTLRDFDQLRGMFEQHMKERHDVEPRKR